MPINLRRVGEVADGSVTTAKLAADAVTSAKLAADAVIAGKIAVGAVEAGDIAAGAIVTADIADGAITGVKAAANLKTSYLVADDTTVSYSGTNYNNEKEMRFVIKEADIPSGEILVKAELMNGGTSGVASAGIFFDAESSPRITLSPVGTGFELIEGTAYIGDLADGIHSVNLSLKHSVGAIVYNKLIEAHGRV